jgi:hypothetical protein
MTCYAFDVDEDISDCTCESLWEYCGNHPQIEYSKNYSQTPVEDSEAYLSTTWDSRMKEMSELCREACKIVVGGALLWIGVSCSAQLQQSIGQYLCSG